LKWGQRGEQGKERIQPTAAPDTLFCRDKKKRINIPPIFVEVQRRKWKKWLNHFDERNSTNKNEGMKI